MNVKAAGGKLVVQVATGPGYHRSSTLLALVNGSASTMHDTDSAQAAIRWTQDAAGKIPCSGGVATNAQPQDPLRTKAADWIQGSKARGANGKLLEDVHWDTPIPPDARHVNIVLVFTDLLVYTFHDHDDSTPQGRRRGDVPAVIGSWSGDLVDGTFRFKVNRADLAPANFNAAGEREYPLKSQIDRMTTLAQQVVKLLDRLHAQAAACTATMRTATPISSGTPASTSSLASSSGRRGLTYSRTGEL